MSRVVSDEPFTPATIDRRASALVFLPTSLRKSAEAMSDTLWMHSNSPRAPAALA